MQDKGAAQLPRQANENLNPCQTHPLLSITSLLAAAQPAAYWPIGSAQSRATGSYCSKLARLTDTHGFTSPWVICIVLAIPRTDWLYNTEPDAGLNNRVQRYPRGKVLGGCSSINGMIYMRGQARDYDGWAKMTGEDSWAWQNALADFKAHESHYRLDQGADPKTGNNSRFSDMHGSGGEWRVEKQRLRWDVLDSFSDAAEQAGIEKIEDFNAGDNAGVGYFDVNQRSGWRWSSSKAFLRPARKRPNLTIWTQAQVEKLTFDTEGLWPAAVYRAAPDPRRTLRSHHSQTRGDLIGRCDQFAANPTALWYWSSRFTALQRH